MSSEAVGADPVVAGDAGMATDTDTRPVDTDADVYGAATRTAGEPSIDMDADERGAATDAGDTGMDARVKQQSADYAAAWKELHDADEEEEEEEERASFKNKSAIN